MPFVKSKSINWGLMNDALRNKYDRAINSKIYV